MLRAGSFVFLLGQI